MGGRSGGSRTLPQAAQPQAGGRTGSNTQPGPRCALGKPPRVPPARGAPLRPSPRHLPTGPLLCPGGSGFASHRDRSSQGCDTGAGAIGAPGFPRGEGALWMPQMSLGLPQPPAPADGHKGGHSAAVIQRRVFALVGDSPASPEVSHSNLGTDAISGSATSPLCPPAPPCCHPSCWDLPGAGITLNPFLLGHRLGAQPSPPAVCSPAELLFDLV